MTTKQLPPRERRLQPTYFIEAYSNGKTFDFQNTSYVSKNTMVLGIEDLERTIESTNSKYETLHTIGIFKIYPKN